MDGLLGRHPGGVRTIRLILVFVAACLATLAVSPALGTGNANSTTALPATNAAASLAATQTAILPAVSAAFCSETIAGGLFAHGIDTNAELASYEATGTFNGEAVMVYLRPLVAQAEQKRAEEAARLAEEARQAEAARAAQAARARAEAERLRNIKPKELEMPPYPYY